MVSLSTIGQLPDPVDAVSITFDDGFRNFAELAWPILRDHGISPTVFVATDHVGATNAWSRDDRGIPALPLLDWEELGRLAGEGVEIGSHTRSHPRLAGMERDRLIDEIEGSGAEIEKRLGRRPRCFAYPYGSHDTASVAVVAREYGCACTTRLDVLRDDDPHLLPRLDAYYLQGPGRIQTWGSASFQRHIRVRGALRSVRAAVARNREHRR